MAENKVYLLDTHIFLWFLTDDKRLSVKTRQLLMDGANRVLLSSVCVWEIVIKKSLGKLRIPEDLGGAIKKSGFKILPIELDHVLELEKLPPVHRDPFDRMLVAQARQENCWLVTADPKIFRYKVKT